MEQFYKITWIRQKYNISTRTLRWYEEKGLIESTRIPGYSYRAYTKDQVRRLEYILYFRKMGIGLQEIGAVLQNNAPEIINDFIKEKRFQIDGQIQRLNQQRDAILGNLTGFSKSLDGEKDEILATLTRGKTHSIELRTLKKVDRMYRSDGEDFWIKDGTLSLQNRERCVFTKEQFSLPVLFQVTAKTSKESLRLYFGPLELIFNWEVEPGTLLFYDHERDHILRIPLGDLIKPEQFVDLYWRITDTLISCSVNDVNCFSLERPFTSHEACSLGFGTVPSNTITVRQVIVTQRSSITRVDLTQVQPEKTIAAVNGEGQLIIRCAGDTMRMITKEEYTLPFVYTAVAKVSSENLRLFFGNGVVILNWEKKSLLWWDPATGEERIFQRLGYISPDRFHTIRQIFTKDAYVLEIDGIAHLVVRDFPYMEQMKQEIPVKGSIGIGTAFGNTVTVKELTVVSLTTD